MITHNLRSDVDSCATPLKNDLLCMLNAPGNTKISYLYVAVTIEHYVLKLDVTMHNKILMQVLYALHHLPEQVLSVELRKFTSLAQV